MYLNISTYYTNCFVRLGINMMPWNFHLSSIQIENQDPPYLARGFDALQETQEAQYPGKQQPQGQLVLGLSQVVNAATDAQELVTAPKKDFRYLMGFFFNIYLNLKDIFLAFEWQGDHTA